jgi:hypothetical protein
MLRPKLPSPAMVVACTALVVACTGTAVAAVSFATNAGAVDGKSAVAAGASRSDAAGRLVATRRAGEGRGRIAARYLDLAGVAAGRTETFGRAFDVQDNAEGAPVAIGTVPGLGTLTASCLDQNPAPGVEDPLTRIVFTNTSGDAVNLARTVGPQAPEIGAVLNGTVAQFNVGGSNTFELHIERRGLNALSSGVIRQDGRGGPQASCLVYGFTLTV